MFNWFQIVLTGKSKSWNAFKSNPIDTGKKVNIENAVVYENVSVLAEITKNGIHLIEDRERETKKTGNGWPM